MARRKWQLGTVYQKTGKRLPAAWWGRFYDGVDGETVHRNVFLGFAGTGADQLTKPLARRKLQNEYINRVNNVATIIPKLTSAKTSTKFAEFAKKWDEEILEPYGKASAAASARSHIRKFLIPEFGKLAVGDIDSERVQCFLNRLSGISPKTVKNVWTTLRTMFNSAVDWKYAETQLRVRLPKSRKTKMRSYSIEEVRRILANTTGAEQMFFWLAAETGMRVGEMTALRVGDVDLGRLSLTINKARWQGTEDEPKTGAGVRAVRLSSRLAAAMMEYVAGRSGYLFQTSVGSPWDASNILDRKLNPLLEELEIVKVTADESATLAEKRAASLGIHSFRHTNATAMDSLHIPRQLRKRRLGHSSSDVTEGYTGTFSKDEEEAAEKLGELFGTNWPEREKKISILFPNSSLTQKRLPEANPEVLTTQ